MSEGGTENALRRAAPVPLVVYATAILGFLARSPFSRNELPLDDGWIHRVYARAFAAGQGFAYNPGVQEAGATSPLWIVLTSPAHWLSPLGGDVVVVWGVKLIGVLLGAAAVGLVRASARRLGASRAAALLAATLFALEPRLLFSALSGMEEILLVVLWLGVVQASLQRRVELASGLLGLSLVTRPEALTIVPLALLGLVAASGWRDPRWRRPATWLLLALPGLAWVAFCLVATGHALPNTFYVKAQPLLLNAASFRTLGQAIAQHGWGATWLVAAGIAALLALAGLRRTPECGLALIGLVMAPLVYLAAVIASRDVHLVGYYWERWLQPATLVLTAAATIGVGLALADVARVWPAAGGRPAGATPASAWGARGIAAALLIALLAALPGLVQSYRERSARLASDSRAIYRMNVEPALWIRDHTPPDAVVGCYDAGATRYFGERWTLDLLGLNSAAVAFGGQELADAMRRVDWMVVSPPGYAALAHRYEPRARFELPLSEYTVCPCPDQTQLVIAERRAPAR